MIRKIAVASLLLSLLSIGIVRSQSWPEHITSYLQLADKFANRDFAMFKFNLSENYYNTSESDMNRYYIEFGNSWANVALALAMSKASKRTMAEVMLVYERNSGRNWLRVADGLGLRIGTPKFYRMQKILTMQCNYWEHELEGNPAYKVM